jgi:hypothetical protein
MQVERIAGIKIVEIHLSPSGNLPRRNSSASSKDWNLEAPFVIEIARCPSGKMDLMEICSPTVTRAGYRNSDAGPGISTVIERLCDVQRGRERAFPVLPYCASAILSGFR